MDLRLALTVVIFLTKDSNRANCPLRSEVSSLNVPVTLLKLPAAIPQNSTLTYASLVSSTDRAQCSTPNF
ncbi:hypothetical protein BofuT4_uP056110.1 [Botrytis cinerea T4]|uniref:Uncharacterized protein n=1 Tax=Botryotinia fuckeliana (strain T4) TaxID=999810 RepID=G2XW40_BOTF4|nr:hypothetical protein BofuT4_uP056110.1 [Botrytis cinerea T4]